MIERIRPFWRRFQRMSEQQYRRERSRLLEKVPVPVFWLLGKTGSGKTSIIRFLTGAQQAEIGNGFQPKTVHSRQYVFPSPQQPLVEFLDTRGLGESAYDPQEDLRLFDRSAHVLVVTVRLTDSALDAIIDPLRKIRRSRPTRPVVLALTCLHQAYPGQQHPPWERLAGGAGGDGGPLPGTLGEHLERQRGRFAELADRVVPIDLTGVEDGLAEPNYGGDALQETLLELLPKAYRQTFLQVEEEIQPLKTLNDRRAMPLVLSYSLMAASAGAVPVPWIDVPLVTAIQSHLVRRLQRIYGPDLDTRFVGSYMGALGGQVIGRLAVRSWLKLIPMVGAAANAALAYSYTYALGKLCCWYFGQVQMGNAPSDEQVRRQWHEQLALAARLWKRRNR